MDPGAFIVFCRRVLVIHATYVDAACPPEGYPVRFQFCATSYDHGRLHGRLHGLNCRKLSCQLYPYELGEVDFDEFVVAVVDCVIS